MTQGQYILCHIFTNDTRRLKIKYEEKYLQKESKGHLEMNVLKSLQTEIYEKYLWSFSRHFQLVRVFFFHFFGLHRRWLCCLWFAFIDLPNGRHKGWRLGRSRRFIREVTGIQNIVYRRTVLTVVQQFKVATCLKIDFKKKLVSSKFLNIKPRSTGQQYQLSQDLEVE